MNIEPGDLCFFIGRYTGWNPFFRVTVAAARDRIVEVTTFEDGLWNFKEPLTVSSTALGFIKFTALILAAAPVQLRPIKPGDGVDEVIRKVGKPAALPKPAVIAHPRSTEFARSLFTHTRAELPLLACACLPGRPTPVASAPLVRR